MNGKALPVIGWWAGFWIGPSTARETKTGLMLLDPKKDKPVRPFR